MVADSGKAHFAQYRSGLKRFEDHPEPCSAQNCAGFSHQGTSSGHRARWCIIPHSLCMRVANGWAAPIPVYALNAALRARICAGTNCAQLCAVPGSAHICTDSWEPDDPSGPPLSARDRLFHICAGTVRILACATWCTSRCEAESSRPSLQCVIRRSHASSQLAVLLLLRSAKLMCEGPDQT